MSNPSQETLNQVAKANIDSHVIDVADANGDPGNGGFAPDQAADLGLGTGSAETTRRIAEHLGGTIIDAQSARAANAGVLPDHAPRFASNDTLLADHLAQREIVAGVRPPTITGRHYRSRR